jgi:transcription antitermination factor NusG
MRFKDRPEVMLYCDSETSGVNETENFMNVAVAPAITPQTYPWYAVRVRSRFEFVTSAALAERGYDTFLPSYRSRRTWSDRTKEIDVPLFPGYLFCRFDSAHAHRVLNSPGVIHVVSMGTKPLPVDEQEVASIQKVCTLGRAAQPWPFLQAGRRVHIECGPLAGTEGIVLKVKSGWRIVVSLTLLQRAVAAEVESGWIRPMI